MVVSEIPIGFGAIEWLVCDEYYYLFGYFCCSEYSRDFYRRIRMLCLLYIIDRESVCCL